MKLSKANILKLHNLIKLNLDLVNNEALYYYPNHLSLLKKSLLLKETSEISSGTRFPIS